MTKNDSSKVIGLCWGEPDDPRTFSGISVALYGKIREMGRLAGAVSSKQWRFTDMLGGALNFSGMSDLGRPRLSRRWMWRPKTIDTLSKRVAPLLRAVDPTAPVLQIGTHAYPIDGDDRAFHCVIDMTVKQAYDAKTFMIDEMNDQEVERAIAAQKHMFDRHDRLFSYCTWVTDSLVNDYDQDPEKIDTCGVGTNLPPLSPNPDKYTDPTILFVGYDWERKGGPLLLESFEILREKVPNARLQIVGCTPETDLPGVEVIGPLDRKDPEQLARLENLFKSATCMSLLPIMDPFPNALFEAQYSYTPIVSIDNGSRREAMEVGETGLLALDRDPKVVAELFAEILSDSERAEQMGHAAHEFVKRKFTWEVVTKRILDVIDENERQRGRR